MARVLVVEDRRENLEGARFVLKRAGHETILARDGLAALQRAVEDAPDAIVMRFELCDFGGMDLCQRLRESPETRGAARLVLYDGAPPVIRTLSSHADVDAWLALHVLEQRLVARVAEALRLARSRDPGALRPLAVARRAATTRRGRPA